MTPADIEQALERGEASRECPACGGRGWFVNVGPEQQAATPALAVCAALIRSVEHAG